MSSITKEDAERLQQRVNGKKREVDGVPAKPHNKKKAASEFSLSGIESAQPIHSMGTPCFPEAIWDTSGTCGEDRVTARSPKLLRAVLTGSPPVAGIVVRSAPATRTICGIDPGVNTGFCVTDNGYITDIWTFSIVEAMAWCLNCIRCYREQGGINTLELVIEDPRNQFVPKGDPRHGSHRLKGVGSVERDAKIWVEFAEFYEIPCRLVRPSKHRKIDAKTFRQWTGYSERTSEHGRCAAMMVWDQKTKA